MGSELLAAPDTKLVRCLQYMVLCWRCCQTCCLCWLFLCFLFFVGVFMFVLFSLVLFPCVSCLSGFIVVFAIRCRHWLPSPSGVSWMVPVGWCFFLLIIQGSRSPSWWKGGGWHDFKMGKQLVKDFGKCTGLHYEADWFNLTSCVAWFCFIFIICRRKHNIYIYIFVQYIYIHIWGDWKTLKEKPNPNHAYLLQRGPFPECFTLQKLLHQTLGWEPLFFCKKTVSQRVIFKKSQTKICQQVPKLNFLCRKCPNKAAVNSSLLPSKKFWERNVPLPNTIWRRRDLARLLVPSSKLCRPSCDSTVVPSSIMD